MLAERLLSLAVRETSRNYLKLQPTASPAPMLPAPQPGRNYMLYMHVPFCTRLCPYCSFNRFPFSEQRAVPYFESLRREMRMVADLGYNFDSIYIGGGTPTVMIDQLCQTIDLARELFGQLEVSTETNPNHLVPEYLERLQGRVQRLSVGVQSFDDGLLAQMDRLEKYGSGQQILERIQQATPYFTSMNADMIFNFPAQTEDMLIRDIEMVVESGCTQTTFYPLMASPAVERSLARTVGPVDYSREERYYKIIDELLLQPLVPSSQGAKPLFTHSSAWTFNRYDYNSGGASDARDPQGAGDDDASAADPQGAGAAAMIDEYVVKYEEYPAIGSGGISYLGSSLFVNTFSLAQYSKDIAAGHMSIMGQTNFTLRDRMRYRFMMQLFGLRLDKRAWERDFGTTVEAGLPLEYEFMRLAGAFATNNADEITLTPKGRYLMVAMMRQFFIGVNNLRDQARAALPPEERELIFSADACKS